PLFKKQIVLVLTSDGSVHEFTDEWRNRRRGLVSSASITLGPINQRIGFLLDQDKNIFKSDDITDQEVQEYEKLGVLVPVYRGRIGLKQVQELYPEVADQILERRQQVLKGEGEEEAVVSDYENEELPASYSDTTSKLSR